MDGWDAALGKRVGLAEGEECGEGNFS